MEIKSFERMNWSDSAKKLTNDCSEYTGTNENIIMNKQAGHMLRTKLSTDNEGGVATGLGACDSPFLID